MGQSSSVYKVRYLFFCHDKQATCHTWQHQDHSHIKLNMKLLVSYFPPPPIFKAMYNRVILIKAAFPRQAAITLDI